MVQSKGKKHSEEESQKGKIGGGRLMADILEEFTNHTEKKFLHDYSYTIFEDALNESKKVLSLDKETIGLKIDEIENYHFVKVTGQIVFNDSNMLTETLGNFNEFGAAVGYMIMRNEEKQLKELEEQISQVKDRNQKAKAKHHLASADMKKLLIDRGLNLEDRFIEKIIYLINHGYKSQFEVQMPFPGEDLNCLFSCILNREFLKDDEYRIIRNYSRETEKPFTIFGILTQTSRNLNDQTYLELLKTNIDNENVTKNRETNLKETLLTVISSLTNIDKGFIGRLDYEYIIDPIAIYREI